MINELVGLGFVLVALGIMHLQSQINRTADFINEHIHVYKKVKK